MRYENLFPSPSSLMESLRDIGYSMETALADVIDNSITAEATNIHINFSWNNSNPWLAILDNGCGMDDQELLFAMKLGSLSPLESRKADDLGRFGLGLKTASFSQCRQVTVVTKKNKTISSMEWDLDQITENPESGWRVKVLDENDLKVMLGQADLLSTLSKQSSGTIVLWRKLDRLDTFDSLAIREKKLNLLIDTSRNHLELTFHRFLNGENKGKRLKIYLNGNKLEGIDPFNTSNNATLELPKQSIYIASKEISVQPFVLPHYSKVTPQEYEKYSGEGGYLHNQGFYVYRNKRLIIKSTWFRLLPKEELTKLIRIRVDIPNSLDDIWKIDVKKSNASPPEAVKKGLRQIISEVEYSGRRVFKQKGHRLKSKVVEPFWNRTINSGKVIYEINKKHSLLESFRASLTSKSDKEFINILKSIESYFPSDLYFNDFANSPESVEKPIISEGELRSIIGVFLPIYRLKGLSLEEIEKEIIQVEPMADNAKLTINLLQDMDIKS